MNVILGGVIMNKVVKTILSLGGLVLVGGAIYKGISNLLHEKDKRINKYKKYYNVTNKWLYSINQGKHLAEYFIDKGYNNIAIYGMGELGCRLYEELKGTPITVSYAIDKEANSKYSEIRVIELNQKLEDVDAIVVTSIFDYDSIKETLGGKTNDTIISLEDIFYDLA